MLPLVSLLIGLAFKVQIRNGPAIAYHSVSPASSFGSRIPRDFHGTRPIAPGPQLAPSSKPSLFMSGQGSSPGRASAGESERCTDQPMNARFTSAIVAAVFWSRRRAADVVSIMPYTSSAATIPTRNTTRSAACPR
jgi:hypothetical protein